MELTGINDILSRIEAEPERGRDHILSLCAALIDWMGFGYVEQGTPRLLDFQTIKLRDALVPAPVTGQEQLYRLTADGQDVRIRFAVLKRMEKRTIQYLVETNVGLTSYQAGMRGIRQVEGRAPYVASQPYFLHFVTTAQYDRLWVIFNEGDQKRVLVFRHRLSQTQYGKILPQWKNIASLSKPELAVKFWKSLDLSEVNKDFYVRIKERFDALVGIAREQAGDVSEDVLKQFAVRLIGRYIFCWFLKEKGIIPAELVSSGAIAQHPQTYFQTYLFKLFFQTLNAEVTDSVRGVVVTERDEHYKNIPYLNGGLFDWHPQEDFLFERLDLNAWLLAFVRVLEGFDFTVDESSSQYQLIAIDPEMLGRIFENLLASQNPDTEHMANQRKAFGAFYTPREVVDYMVNESLKAFLESRMLPPVPDSPQMVAEPAETREAGLFDAVIEEPVAVDYSRSARVAAERARERLKPKIDKLFAPDCAENPFDKSETPLIRKALSEVTVLDPACGSGAFPMGVLLRLMELRQIVGHGHRNNYDLKEEILSRNIFGVDIMPMAVEIARLRAWLSLVLEAEYKPNDRKNNFGIAALPNLDFKFVCANSLIDSGYDVFLEHSGRNQALQRLDRQIHKLEELRATYFDPRGDKARKSELQHAFFATKGYIKTEFENLRKSWNLESFLARVDDWNPFDDSHPSSFFSPAWMFGLRDGFDIVIGNPPYVQIQKMEEGRKQELALQGFETFERTGDLYQLFYELGIKLLRPSGTVAFITSNKWMRAHYGASTRSMLARCTTPLCVVDFGMALVFETATILTNIFIGRKSGGSPDVCMCRIRDDFDNPAFLNDYVRRNIIRISNPREDSWVAYGKQEYDLIRRIEDQGIPIKDWNIRINYGIKTGFNDAFFVSQEVRDALVAEDPASAEIIRPLLRGEDIKAYVPEFAGVYLINAHNGVKHKGINPINVAKDYPAVYNWLLRFQSELAKRQDQGAHWTNLRNCAYVEDFSKPKIIYPNMTKFLPFVYDETGIVTNQKCFIATGEHLKYLTGVLNSSLWKFAFRNRFPELLGETYELSKVFFDKIPVKKPFSDFESLISNLVDEIIRAKRNSQDTSGMERQMDLMVCHLYGLTLDESRIIDPTIREQEYENAVVSGR
jgi:type I restriction-modification system DNA methylase subunit